MTEPHPVTAERVREVLELFGHDFEAANRQLAGMYAPNVTFRDPIQTLHGLDSFLAMNRRLRARSRRLAFEVSDAAQDSDRIFLAWSFEFAPKLGPTLRFEGSSLLRLENGLVAYHRDYWDLLGGMVDAVPGLRVLYRAVLASLG